MLEETVLLFGNYVNFLAKNGRFSLIYESGNLSTLSSK